MRKEERRIYEEEEEVDLTLEVSLDRFLSLEKARRTQNISIEHYSLNGTRNTNSMKRILVVDDDAAQRKTIAIGLKSNGYEVLEAENGLVGLETARAEKPDLIITDVYMDAMNGFMMAESLQEEPETENIPVIMMTNAAQAAGAWNTTLAVEYLDKGFAMSELLETIERVFRSIQSS
jgi:twitching motility two-component system response regulator PilH